MSPEQLASRLGMSGVVPVVALEQPESVLPLADALLQAGLEVIEITFRTRAAAEAIRLLRRERPQILVGAGTILTFENLAAAKANGATFAVAPGLNRPVLRAAQRMELPFIPGIATPSELEQALSLGCTLLKFFPAEALGGVAMLEALSAPYEHTGVRFLPTGGITPANLESYLRLETVAAVGGTWLAKREDVKQGHWQQIVQRTREAIDIAHRAGRG